MIGKVTKVLDDFHTITPHLTVRGVADAIAFYCRAFGAAELYRNLAPDGKSVMHAELRLGDSRFLLHDEFPEHGSENQVCSQPIFWRRKPWPFRSSAFLKDFTRSRRISPCATV
jgi:hypothetical protein